MTDQGAAVHHPAAPGRAERRKAATRRALLDAAAAILVEGGSTSVSIQEITDRADVGFGTFYNHFESKDELFEAAVGGVLEAHGAWLAEVTVGVDDPAELLATRFRLTAGLASTAPDAATVFVRSGLDFLLSDRGLAPMALADLDAAIAAGRIAVGGAHLGLAITGGCLLAFLQYRLRRPELVGAQDADELTEALLVALGMEPAEAARLAHLPLPG